MLVYMLFRHFGNHLLAIPQNNKMISFSNRMAFWQRAEQSRNSHVLL